MATNNQEQAFFDGMKQHLEIELIKVTEPLVIKAVQDYEQAIRAKVGMIVLAGIERHYSVEKRGMDLMIHIRNFKASE
jgi:hypothetical protein